MALHPTLNMKKLHLFLLLLAFTTSVFAQKSENTTPIYRHQFGLHGGFTSGFGLAYRYWPKKLGIEGVILPEVYGYHDNNFSYGLSGFLKLHETRYIDLFCYLSNSWYVEKWTAYGYKNINVTHNVGFGPGISLGDRIRFNLMAGIALFDTTDKNKVGLTAETGLYFKF